MNQDFLDLLRAFTDREVRFLVVGAYALAFHGHPRATGDLDVWIDASPINSDRAYQALCAFGAPLNDLKAEDLVHPGVVYQMGVAPFRIDILTKLSGIAFEDAWPGRLVQDIEGLSVPFIGREALIHNKRATGRTQDLADLEALGEA
ncbi:MAG: hypothetical protein ACRD26_18675 [Vicinamibacterales bacterium]